MFGLKEEYPMVPLLEDDSVKTERPDDSETAEREIKIEVKIDQDSDDNMDCEPCSSNGLADHRLTHTDNDIFKCRVLNTWFVWFGLNNQNTFFVFFCEFV